MFLTAKCPQCGRDVPEDARYCPYCGTRLKVSNLGGEIEYYHQKIAEYRYQEISAGIMAFIASVFAGMFFAMSSTVVYETKWRCVITWGGTCIVWVPEFTPSKPFESVGLMLGILFTIFAIIGIASAAYYYYQRNKLIEKLREIAS